MKILDIYEIKETDYKSADCTGKFPVYGSQIFKPLNKTKTCLTPLFAFSEVFWSYYIQRHFVSDTPRYFLAKCRGIENEFPIYSEEGTLVFNVLKDKESLISLTNYFMQNPDSKVDITNYENHHNILYSYTDILDSKIFRKRKDLRHQLEMQILLSLLIRDENFHYGNVAFIVENGKIKRLCPPLDFEFSLMFMYPDMKNRKENTIYWRNDALVIPYKKRVYSAIGAIKEESDDNIFNISLNNISKIVSLDPALVKEFITKLDSFISDIENTDILVCNKGFFDALSSEAWEIYDARYVKQNEFLALKKELGVKYTVLDQKQFNASLKQECLENAKELKFNLQVLLVLRENNSLNDITIKRFLALKGIDLTKEEYRQLSIDEKLELLNEQKVKKIV